MLRSCAVSIGRTSRAVRATAAAALLLAASIPIVGGSASGAETIGDLKARMAAVQARLDEATRKIEATRSELEETRRRAAATKDRMAEIVKKNDRLQEVVIERARDLYMSGRGDMLEAIFGAESFGELTDAAEMLSTISLDDSDVFIELARAKAELLKLQKQLDTDEALARDTYEEVVEESKKQQALFDSISADYEKLQDQMTPAAPSAPSAARVRASGGMACPVAGPVSFTDTWGAPRSGGRSHEGTDMMAGYGTPVVAIVSGTITYSAYNGSGGYMIFLSGNDGNQYWYLHNQQNMVSSGARVSVGQQIATVGDTGNAAGTPHVHFEYHPGGGGPVNPYPLLASIC